MFVQYRGVFLHDHALSVPDQESKLPQALFFLIDIEEMDALFQSMTFVSVDRTTSMYEMTKNIERLDRRRTLMRSR